MAKFPMDLAKFKKVSSDEKTTTLKHPDGHEIRIAHNGVSAKMRKELHSIPMAKGGEVDEALADKAATDKENRARMESGEEELPYTPKTKKVLDTAEDVTPPRKKMAEGGEAEDKGLPESKAGEAEQGADEIAAAATADETPSTESTAAAAIPNSPGDVAANSTVDLGAPEPTAAEPTAAAPVVQAPSKGPGTPTAEEAYSKQVAGIQQGAAAEAQGAKQQAAVLKNAADVQQQALQDYTKEIGNLNAERQAHIQDIQNKRINPEAYWDNHSKLAAGIGLIIAGFNPSGHSNGAAEFLDSQIQKNIDAQKANLDSEHNLLNANLRQFGNMRDAQDMTKVMLNDVVSNQLKQAALKAQSPIAKARALQEAGKLEMEVAPLFEQLATRRSLMRGGQQAQVGGQPSNLRAEDPAAYVPSVVPKEHQEGVYKEVERAQDTRRMADSILEAFDKAAVDVRPLSGGRLKNILPGTESGYVSALHQAMQPTFKDLEGTVRQAAMDNTFTNITPRMGNSDKEVAIKRKSLVDYLQSKTSAPRAKSYGIDLDKFASSANKPELKLTPQQQAFANWAKANPNDPRAQQVLKKLKLSE